MTESSDTSVPQPAPTRADSPARSERRAWRPLALRLGLELVVVFIGVYAAFALAESQARREAEERRQQIRSALVRELRDITANTRGAVTWTAAMVAFYDSAFAAAGTPALTPLIEPIRVRAHMWDATLESGGLALMDVRTIYQLSQFYNELNAGFEQLEQLRALSETVLIPNLDRGASEFYDASGRPRSKYDWYTQGLRNLHRLAERITAMGDSLVLELGEIDAAHP